jgi:hypothetical protein
MKPLCVVVEGITNTEERILIEKELTDSADDTVAVSCFPSVRVDACDYYSFGASQLVSPRKRHRSKASSLVQ